jgi:hypothetical protein
MKRSSRNAQIIIAIPLGLLMGYLLINVVNAAAHQHLFMKGFLGMGIFMFIIGVIAEILIWYYTRGKLVIHKGLNHTLEITISFPSGSSESDKGNWNCEGIFVKEYAKYGMYKKHLGLNLSCNGKPACLLRHELGGFAADPEHFREVNTLYNLGGTEYWCKKVKEIEEIVSQSHL